jgi:hypothetical protein
MNVENGKWDTVWICITHVLLNAVVTLWTIFNLFNDALSGWYITAYSVEWQSDCKRWTAEDVVVGYCGVLSQNLRGVTEENQWYILRSFCTTNGDYIFVRHVVLCVFAIRGLLASTGA